MADLTLLTLTALITVVGLVHAFLSRRLYPRGWRTVLFITALTLAMLWVPQGPREAILSVVCAGLAIRVFGLLVGSFGGLVIIPLIYGVGLAIPGGAFTLIPIIIATVGFSAARAARQRRRQISRASALQPNEKVTSDVEFSGRVRSLEAVTLPGTDKRVAAWVVWLQDLVKRRSKTMLKLQGDYGVVLVDAQRASLDIGNNRKTLTGDDALAVYREVGEEPWDVEYERDPSVDISWIEEGAEVCVIGCPDRWQTHVLGDGFYRHSPHVPVFCEGVELADRSSKALNNEARWRFWTWAMWCPVWIVVAAYFIHTVPLPPDWSSILDDFANMIRARLSP